METEWLDKWFYEGGNRPITAVGEYFDGEPPDMPLTVMLNIDPEDVKPFALEFMRSASDESGLGSELTDLRWGLRAYLQFQDILPIGFDVGNYPTPGVFESERRQNYCYYESLVYLRESVVSWLDRNVLASLALLRPFLELAVSQSYWSLNCAGGGLETYHKWLKGDKDRPHFGKALDDVFRTMPARLSVPERRMSHLKETIRSFYKALCAYEHVPRLDDSVAAKGRGLGNTAYESFCYALYITNICLHQVLFLYVLAYPMSLFPVERHRKWAFGGPVGLFFDRCNYAIVERYIGPRNASALKRSLASMTCVKELLQWYGGFPDLTDDQIEADWQRVVTDTMVKPVARTLAERLTQFKAHHRAIGWLMNYESAPEPDDDLSDEEAERRARQVRTW